MADVTDLVGRFYDRLWNAAAYDEAPGVLHPDLVFRGSIGMEKRGIDGFLEYARHVSGALEGFTCDVRELIAEGDRAAARMHFHGLHRGPFMGVAPTGRRVAWNGAAFFRVADARLAEIWVLGDTDGLRAALAGGG